MVITGAARGIGAKVARVAAARGARLALIGLEPDRLRTLADDLGPAASWWEADVRDGAALRSAIDGSAETMGGVDIVVANAGVVAYGTVRQMDAASFERVVDINLNGVFRTLKYATPHVERSRGHVTVVASAISFTPLAGMASYAASKAGVEMLTLAYRQEVAHLGVTVGLVHPSWIDTDVIRGAEADLPSLSVLGTPVKVDPLVVSSLFDLTSAPCSGRWTASRGSRWSARSAARTNDLEADEDAPHTGSARSEGKRCCGSSHVAPP